MDCQRRFAAVYGTSSFYSHQSPEVWGAMIKLTLAGSTLEAVSQALDINIATAFRMRHKLMCSLEEEAVTTVIAEQAELDEKYVLKSHKGTKLEHVPGKKRGVRASKRGISNE